MIKLKQYKPFTSLAAVRFRHAKMMRAPRFAKSLAVSRPMPPFAPVINTVLPSILARDLHFPSVIKQYKRRNDTTNIVDVTTTAINICRSGHVKSIPTIAQLNSRIGKSTNQKAHTTNTKSER